MKRVLLAALTGLFLVAAVAISGGKTEPLAKPPAAAAGPLQIQSEARNPWTHLRLNNDAADFQFAIISDRTGGHRARIFSRAVEQLNLLQPEFVLSVGDLIEGYTEKPDVLQAQWIEFQSYVSKLQMPFFYTPGNHDITNKTMEKLWQDKFGRRYFHFVYKDVLFLILCSEDPPGKTGISAEQVAYVKKTLEEVPSPRWTIVALHKPVWNEPGASKGGWLEIEQHLATRPYTVFAGHVHRYQKFVRNGRNYYQLATTGGGSRLRGVRYGEFDHLVWATMKKDGPVLANIMLDGVLPENLESPNSDETGFTYERKPTHPVRGKVYLDGTPLVGVTVGFWLKPGGDKKPQRVADALVEADGSFQLYAYGQFDGSPAGDYVVTVSRERGPTEDEAKVPVGIVPEKYRKVADSPLTATVKTGPNEFTFELK